MFILDAHCDAPSQMLRLRDFSLDNHHAQVDFPKMKRGGVYASFFACYVPCDKPDPLEYARSLMDVTKRQIASNPGVVALARSSSEIKENYDNGLISIILALENGAPIGNSFEILHELYDEGVRYVTLTHSKDNRICDSCSGSGTWGGLSPFGKELVREMNRIGMLIDLAHCSNDTVRDVLRITSQPVAFTHGSCSALCNHRRNLPDELLRGIAETGGVVGISLYPSFISPEFDKVLKDSGLESKSWIEDKFISDPSNADYRKAWESLQDELAALPRPGVGTYADHLEHAIEICGVEHIGIGTDYDGIEVTPRGMETIESLPLVFGELSRRGYSDRELSLIASGNYLRLLP